MDKNETDHDDTIELSPQAAAQIDGALLELARSWAAAGFELSPARAMAELVETIEALDEDTDFREQVYRHAFEILGDVMKPTVSNMAMVLDRLTKKIPGNPHVLTTKRARHKAPVSKPEGGREFTF